MTKTLTLKKGKTEAKKPLKPSSVRNAGKVHSISNSQPPLTPSTSTNMTTATTPQVQQTAQTPQATAEAQAAAELQAQMLQTAQSMVDFKVLAPFVSCLITPDQIESAIKANYKELYVWNAGQLFKQMQLIGGRHVRMKVDHLPSKFKPIEDSLRATHVKIEEELCFLPAGKIPGKYWDQIVTFFRQVMKLKKADMEAHAWILWSEERGYFISVPKQIVSKASVSYTPDSENLPDGAIIVVDIHSHNTMGAFYSGTDNNDDKTKIFYTGVVGKITDNDYEWVMRFNMHDIKKTVDLSEIFELQEVVDIPADWLDQVEVQTHTGRGKHWSAYIGNNTGKAEQGNVSGTSERSTQSPAKWTAGFPTSQQQIGTGGAGSNTGEPTFRDVGSLWDHLDDGAFGFGTSTEDERGNVNYDGDKDVFRRSPGKREEMESLLRSVPTVDLDDIDRLDRQATEWLSSKGYDQDGNDMMTLARDDIREMKRTFVADDGSEDPVGSDDTNQSDGSEASGKAANDAYELIDVMITDLEGNDDALMDIATQCYHLMSNNGRQKLETHGF